MVSVSYLGYCSSSTNAAFPQTIFLFHDANSNRVHKSCRKKTKAKRLWDVYLEGESWAKECSLPFCFPSNPSAYTFFLHKTPPFCVFSERLHISFLIGDLSLPYNIVSGTRDTKSLREAEHLVFKRSLYCSRLWFGIFIEQLACFTAS